MLIATCTVCDMSWHDIVTSRGQTIQAVSYAIQHYKDTGHRYTVTQTPSVKPTP